MDETIESVEYIVRPTSRQSGKTNEQQSRWKPSTGQKWSNTDSQELEIIELPISSTDEYYELIKQSLFWVDINLMDDASSWGLLEKEWVIKAHSSELKRGQEKLIKELFHIINGFNSRDTSTLQRFFKKNRGNPDLKAVLDLKVGASELTIRVKLRKKA